VILFATAAGPDGVAAALPWEDGTVARRLLDQLRSFGMDEAHVITRPEFEDEIRGALRGARIHISADAAGDLLAVAEIARAGTGGLVLAPGEVVTQREALAGLMLSPKLATGVLASAGAIARPFGFRIRNARGRLVSAASPYHSVRGGRGTFLGVLKVAAADREALAESAERVGALAHSPPDAWRAELEAKAVLWRRGLVRMRLAREAQAAGAAPPPAPLAPEELDGVPITAEDEAELARHLAAAPDDAASMLLVALVRSGAHVGSAQLRQLFWARPLSRDAADRAARDVQHHDEDKALLESAVKGRDGFFTTFFVSPYSKYIARWAARRGFTPNQVTTVSLLIGLAAAAAFATGERAGLIAGAILLQIAFTTDCVDGQLARYTRQFSKLGAWLDSVFDRAKEYLAFAGLAIGASRTGDPVWLLAGAAIALQTVRHSLDFAYPAAQHEIIAAVRQPPLEQAADGAPESLVGPDDAEDESADPLPEAAGPRPPLWRRLDHSSKVRWLKRIIQFPIGERFAAISVAAALTDARTTFIVVLAWNTVAVSYLLTGRVLRSLGTQMPAGAELPTGPLELYRDDGPVARLIGRALGRAVPLPPTLAIATGAIPLFAAIAAWGDDASPGQVAAAVAWLVLWGGVSAGRPLRERLRWLTTVALRAAEYTALLWIAAVAGDSSKPAAFALLAAIVFRFYETVYRLRTRGTAPPRWVGLFAGGWDGRVIVAAVLLAVGALPAGFWIAAGILGAVFVGEAVTGWVRHSRRRSLTEYEDEEEEID
jgi:phosphatidylglycerophosphate synthase